MINKKRASTSKAVYTVQNEEEEEEGEESDDEEQQASSSKGSSSSKGQTRASTRIETANVIKRKPSSSRVGIVNGKVEAVELSGGRAKRYACTEPGCSKAYTRPGRLEEHTRSHTGERPFKCPSCHADFGRESHLKAHVRSHATEEDKPCACDQCDKRFWTNQHLNKHVEVIHNHTGKTYDCLECEEKFRKHHQLKAHVAAIHRPPGADPFECPFPDCTRTFKQLVHLKTHGKSHDTSRYVCANAACLEKPIEERTFSNWTALQRHTKLIHPPTCHYPECDGKTFTSNRGLKNHLIIHTENEAGGEKSKKRMRGRGSNRTSRSKSKLENEKGKGKGKMDQNAIDEDDEEEEEAVDTEMENGTNDGGGITESEAMDEDDVVPAKKSKVIRAEPVDGLWSCEVSECGRAFNSVDALIRHEGIAHEEQDVSFTGTTSDSDSSAIAARLYPSHQPSSVPPPSVAKASKTTQGDNVVDLLSGNNYVEERKYACPYLAARHLCEKVVGGGEEEEDEMDEDDSDDVCAFRFKRVYDVVRHLRAAHALEANIDVLQEWYDAK